MNAEERAEEARHREWLRTCSLEDACEELGNAVYRAALFLERLENAGHKIGNGHHAAQAIAKMATDELRRRWPKEDA